MTELRRTDHTETYADLCCTLCWDDDEDPETALASGVYAVAAGEWRREADGLWRFWEDEVVMRELKAKGFAALTSEPERE